MNITENIAAKKKRIEQLDQKIEAIQLAKDWKAVERLIKIIPSDRLAIALPFNTFSLANYTIFVGRNNKSNDILTFDYAKKDEARCGRCLF